MLKMREATIVYPGGDYWNLHREFHRVLTSYGNGAQWVRTFLELLWQNTERYRALYTHEVKSLELIHHDHENLFKAAKNRDGKLLVNLMKKHIVDNRKIILKSLQNSEIGS